jgi:outer membrane receptor protein involved in Fe transport
MCRLIKFLGFSLLAGKSLFGNAELYPMEISALRLETEAKNLPARVQVIDAEKIEKSGSTDLVGLLRKEANLQVSSTSGNSARSTVSMGGFGENGQLRTLVLVDGHRVNAIDMSPINWYSIPLALVESIEVIRGGQSGTYGNHAVGGVIKINTKLPQTNPTGSIEASAGSFDSYSARGAYSQRIGEIGLTIFGDRVESDGYRVNGGHETDAGGLRLDWGSESDLRGYLSWAVSDSEYGLPGSLSASQLMNDRRQTLYPDDGVQERSSHGRAGLSYEINSNWRIENRFGYQDRDINEQFFWTGGFYLADKVYQTFSYSPALHFNSNQADWRFGFDFTDAEFDSKSTDNSGEETLTQYQRVTTAFLVSVGVNLSDDWNFNGNIRLERAENSGDFDLKKDEWAGGIGLVREFEGDDRIYGTIRRFYRYPAMDEYYSVWSGLNPNLMPENGYEMELGGDWSMDQFSLSGRIFRQWMDGEIVYDTAKLDPSDPWSSQVGNINLPKIHRVGLDFSLECQITESILSGLSYEYVKATFEDGTSSTLNYSGSRVPLVPEGLIRLYLELRPVDSLLLSFGGSYAGESYRGSDFSNIETKLDDYWLFDLGVNYQLSESATLFGGVENLFNEEYLSTAFGSGLYPGEGRRATVGLRYSF